MRRVVDLFVDRAVADPCINYDRGGMYPQNSECGYHRAHEVPGARLSKLRAQRTFTV